MEDGQTVEQARARVAASRDVGMDCPVCDQHVKQYSRLLSKDMVRMLGLFYRKFGLQPGKFSEVPNRPRGGDYAKLRHWGLIVRAQHSSGNSAGWWRVTSEGQDFLNGKRVLPSHLWLFQGEPTGEVPEWSRDVSIRDVLGLV